MQSKDILVYSYIQVVLYSISCKASFSLGKCYINAFICSVKAKCPNVYGFNSDIPEKAATVHTDLPFAKDLMAHLMRNYNAKGFIALFSTTSTDLRSVKRTHGGLEQLKIFYLGFLQFTVTVITAQLVSNRLQEFHQQHGAKRCSFSLSAGL